MQLDQLPSTMHSGALLALVLPMLTENPATAPSEEESCSLPAQLVQFVYADIENDKQARLPACDSR